MRADQAVGVVAAANQVVDHMRVVVRRCDVIALGEEAEGAAIQLATGVVLVGGQGEPAVFVQVEATLVVDVTGAGLQGAFHHPHAVLLPAHQLRIQMVRRGQRPGVLDVGERVGVVRHEHFLLADQLPVVAVQRAVEHVDVVEGAGAGGARVRRVVGQARRQLDATLAGQVLPGATWVGQRVGRVLEHQRLADAAGRAGVVEFGLEVGVLGVDDLV
ncbi:hypothetical protein D3C78_1323530 [compost metagenome]